MYVQMYFNAVPVEQPPTEDWTLTTSVAQGEQAINKCIINEWI